MSLRAANKARKAEKIRAAARKLFAAKGFEKTTTKEIAEKAGIGTGTLFLYVRNKEEILFLIFEEEVGQIVERIFGELKPAQSLVDKLMAVFTALFEYYCQSPELSRAIVKEFVFLDPVIRDRYQTFTTHFAARLGSLIDEARVRGEVRADVPTALAMTAVFSLYVMSLVQVLNTPSLPMNEGLEELRMLLKLTVRGLVKN